MISPMSRFEILYLYILWTYCCILMYLISQRGCVFWRWQSHHLCKDNEGGHRVVCSRPSACVALLIVCSLSLCKGYIYIILLYAFVLGAKNLLRDSFLSNYTCRFSGKKCPKGKSGFRPMLGSHVKRLANNDGGTAVKGTGCGRWFCMSRRPSFFLQHFSLTSWWFLWCKFEDFQW